MGLPVKALNILLADDSPSVGQFVASYLGDAGHVVTFVLSGEAAVIAYREQSFDLVLMDIVMPGIGGLEAIKQIKAIPTKNWVPIIIITAANSEEDLLGGFMAGADDFLPKPVEPLALDIRIRSMMRIAAIQRASTTVVDSVIEGIIQIDRGGRICRFNRSAERIFGYTEAEVMHRNVKMLMPSPYVEQHDDYIAAYVQTRQAKVIGHPRLVTGLRKNGEQFPMQLAVAEANTPDAKYFVGTVRDLSIEEQLRRQLADKTEELERFFGVSLDLYCIAGRDGRFRKINAAWERVLGYPLAELENRDFFDFVHPDDLDITRSVMSRLGHGETVSGFTNRYRTSAGSYRYIEWQAVPYDNQLIYAAARDVTVSREREMALAKSERFMKLLVDVLPGMVGYWTSDLQCRFANRNYFEWFGKTAEEMRNIALPDVLGSELYRKNEPHIQAALRGETQRFERTMIKPDGSTGHTWAHYIPDVIDGEVKGFFVLVADVTELKLAETALRENRRFLSDLIEHSGTLVFAKDAEGRYTLVNKKYEESTGMSREQVLGRSDVELHKAADAQRFREHDLLVMNSGAPSELEESLDGHAFLTIKFPLRDEVGMVNGVCGIATDITERKKIQDEVVRLSQLDVLTGLANRRHFMVLAEQEMSRTRRYGGPLSALMLDVDFFKKINDTHGHKAGDAVLSMLGERCRNALRTIDIVGRVGGEEFAFLLPQTTAEKAAEVAERLRRSIADLPVELDDGHLLTVTVSIGVAGLGGTETTVDTLIGLADKALYAAKDGGRNRVFLAD